MHRRHLGLCNFHSSSRLRILVTNEPIKTCDKSKIHKRNILGIHRVKSNVDINANNLPGFACNRLCL